MTTQRKSALLTLLLALSLILAGCAGLTGTDDDTTPDNSDVDTEQLRTASLEAMENVETVRATQNLTMDLGGTSIATESEGVIDISAKKARFIMTSSTAGTEFEQTQYLVDDTMYFKSGAFGGWVKQNVSGFNAWGNNQFAQQERLLDGAEMNVTDQRTIDGNEVYVTELDVDSETLSDLFNAQAGNVSSRLASGVSLDDASVTQHIDVETNRIRYANIEYSLTVRGQKFTFSLEQRFSEFNEPVGIELPEEAKSAEPIEETYGGGYSAAPA